MNKNRFIASFLAFVVLSVFSFSTLCSAQNTYQDAGFADSTSGNRYLALSNTTDLTNIDRQALKEKIANVTKTDDKPQRGVQSFISEYWVQFLALLVSLIGVFFAVTGFTFAGQKKKNR